MNIKRFSQDTKLTIQIVLALILVFVGVILLFFGFFAPPYGDISNSVLVAYGEVSTFGGSLLGVDYHYKYKVYKIDADLEQEEIKRKKDEYTDTEC